MLSALLLIMFTAALTCSHEPAGRHPVTVWLWRHWLFTQVVAAFIAARWAWLALSSV